MLVDILVCCYIIKTVAEAEESTSDFQCVATEAALNKRCRPSESFMWKKTAKDTVIYR